MAVGYAEREKLRLEFIKKMIVSNEARQANEHNGIPWVRIQNPEANLRDLVTCDLCKNVMWEGIECSSCRNLFCSQCIMEYSANHFSKCLCGNIFIAIAMNKCTEKIFKQLRVFCVYKVAGCPEALPYNELKQHEASCNYCTITCPRPSCSQMILRMQLQEHEQVCEYAAINCQYCHKPFPRKDKHFLQCPEAPVACEFCSAECPRKNLEEHLQTCPEREIVCTQCQQKIAFKMRTTHNCVSCLRDMMGKMQEQIQTLQRENEEMRTRTQRPQELPIFQEIKEEQKESQANDRHIAKRSLTQQSKDPSLVISCEKCGRKGIANAMVLCAQCQKEYCHSCIRYCVNCFEHLCEQHQEANTHCAVIYVLNIHFLFLYDIESKQRIFLPKPSTGKGRKALSSVRIRNQIYLTGGGLRQNPLTISVCFSYPQNFGEGSRVTQSLLAPMLTPKYYHTLVAMDANRFVSIGGLAYDHPLSQCEVYSIEENKWHPVPALNRPTAIGIACNVKQRWMYVFGNIKKTKEEVEVWEFGGSSSEGGWQVLSFTINAMWRNSDNPGTATQLTENTLLLVGCKQKSVVVYLEEKQIQEEETLPVCGQFSETALVHYRNNVYLCEQNEQQLMKFGNKKWGLDDKLHIH